MQPNFQQELKKELITATLKSLQWFPVHNRIDFRVILLVYKALNGFTPLYMLGMLRSYEPPRPLRSSGAGLLIVPRVNSKSGEAVFSFYAPCCCNASLRISYVLRLFPLNAASKLFFFEECL